MIYTNIDQFVNKRDDLCMMISSVEPDVILLTEVIPKAQLKPIGQALLAIPHYSMYLNFDPDMHNLSREGRRGIAIFAKSELRATEVSFNMCPLVEHLWIRIPLRSPDQMIVGCIYHSPSVNGYLSTNELIGLLKTSTSSKFSHVLIAGDINMPQIDWVTNFSHAPDHHFTHMFVKGTQECLLFQHVTKPTRYRAGEKPSTLDVILSNEEGLIKNLVFLPPVGNSDHIVLKFNVTCYAQRVESTAVHLNYNKGNYQQLNALIHGTDWEVVAPVDPQRRFEVFKATLKRLISQCIPRACPTRKRRSLYMNREALRLKNRKRKLWNIYIRSQDVVSYSRYSRCKNDLRRLTRNLRLNYEQNLVSNIKYNPKAFWRYAGSRLKSRTGVEDLRTEGGNLTSNDQEKARVLNRFFFSVCIHEDPDDIPVLANLYDGPTVDDVDITVELVRNKLAQLKPSSAAGPDEIHPRVLCETADTISPRLATIFRESLDTGVLPRDWKLANVVPIYKKGQKDDPGNYRPVSLTSVPCKVLEGIIRDRLMAHLQSENLLSDAKHGFRPGRSCATQLLQAIEEWSNWIERSEPVDVLYLDLAKAFNTVPHGRLIEKVRAHGIGGKLLCWIEAFLSGRQQRVMVEGCQSGWAPVPSGVPQGSVLAPLLFLLFINDLPGVLSCGVKIFADDSKLYRSVHASPGPLALQEDLDAASRWADAWKLEFNADKCKVLHIGRQNPQQVYHLKGTQMEQVAAEKDLGVYVDTELKFRKQAAAAVSKASRILSMILRSFQLIDKSTLPLLFKTLVRPHLEYGNIVWGPFNRTDQKLVERVQRRATKKIPELRDLPYTERLQALKLPSLYYRRRRGDMIAMYQMLHGGIDLDSHDFFERSTARVTRGHSWRLLKPRAVTRVRRNAFSVRFITDRNSLPSGVIVDANTLNQFKNRLDTHWDLDGWI